MSTDAKDPDALRVRALDLGLALLVIFVVVKLYGIPEVPRRVFPQPRPPPEGLELPDQPQRTPTCGFFRARGTDNVATVPAGEAIDLPRELFASGGVRAGTKDEGGDWRSAGVWVPGGAWHAEWTVLTEETPRTMLALRKGARWAALNGTLATVENPWSEERRSHASVGRAVIQVDAPGAVLAVINAPDAECALTIAHGEHRTVATLWLRRVQMT